MKNCVVLQNIVIFTFYFIPFNQMSIRASFDKSCYIYVVSNSTNIIKNTNNNAFFTIFVVNNNNVNYIINFCFHK